MMSTSNPQSDNPKLDRLIAEYVEAIEREVQPDRQRILAENPEHAGALQDFFHDFDRLQATKLRPAPHAERATSRDNLEPGSVIAGRYKLLENIGQGGMGSIWVAEQKEPVKRKVAVKVIKAGMDSREVLARFDAERQALAVMDHPNIAKVFDGGVTEQGRPFFVMEYVKGVPFTEYCDTARLTLMERMQLFVPVCQAVQHAHHKGIVHRDLKPSNILVCLYDGKPVPKVIDFGLAKALHQPLTEQSIYTAHGAMVGTPLYMSPEQAEQNNLDVDTRTDVYSLGVVLYELLTGTTPLEREQLRKAAYAEVLRLIKEVEPPRPSLRLSGSASLPSIAAQRNIEPRHLRRSLSGDLDWIVMKALEKERSRRYETASGLARDIERFLEGEAVEACPPSTLYRLRKFIAKHKVQTVAALMVAVALLLGVAGTTWQMLRAQEAERSAIRVSKEFQSYTDSLQKVTEQIYAVLWDAKEEHHKTQDLPDHGTESKSWGTYRLIVSGSGNDLQVQSGFSDGTIQEHPKDWGALQTIDQISNPLEARKDLMSFLEEQPLLLATFIRDSQRELIEARDSAERKLVEGILRPIGQVGDPNPAELRAFVDWAALSDDRLKLKVLEVAFDDPETALRVAYRADRAMQACVTISPTRRATALEFLATKQCDQSAPPAIRTAACWLTLELGSNDVPALSESITFLMTPPNPARQERHPFLHEFSNAIQRSFATLTANQVEDVWDALLKHLGERTDQFEFTPDDLLLALAPRVEAAQIDQACDTLLQIIRTSANRNAVEEACRNLRELVPLLDTAHSTQAWDAVLLILKKQWDRDVTKTVMETLGILAPRVDVAHVPQAWDSLIDFLKTDAHFSITKVLVVFAPRLENDQRARAFVSLLGFLNRNEDGTAVAAALSTLAGLVEDLDANQVTQVWHKLLDLLDTDSLHFNPVAAFEAIEALAPRLEPAEVPRVWDSLIALIQKTTDYEVGEIAASALKALIHRIDGERIQNAGSVLIERIATTSDSPLFSALADALEVLAPEIDPGQRQRAFLILNDSLQNAGDWVTRRAACDVVVALVPTLDPNQIVESTDSLIAALPKTDNYYFFQDMLRAIIARLPQLHEDQASNVRKVLIDILSRSEVNSQLKAAAEGLVAFVPSLPSDQVAPAWDALIDVIRSRRGHVTDTDAIHAVGHVLVALAGRLEAPANTRACGTLIDVIQKTKDSVVLKVAFEALVVLAPQLDATQIDRAWNTVLEFLTGTETYFASEMAGDVLVALAPRVSPEERIRAADAMLASLRQIERGVAVEPLQKLMPHLDQPHRSRIAHEMQALLLGYYGTSISGLEFDFWASSSSYEPSARAFEDPKALAEFLRHPACAGEPREYLLQHFEELVFHNGQAVFLTDPPAKATGSAVKSDKASPPPEPPQRRFHSIHDAAAWIQKNWSDFDLETTLPVTWQDQ